MTYYEIPTPGRPRPPSGLKRRPWWTIVLIAAIVVLLGARTLASYVIEYQWWREMGQVETWIDMLLYGVAPVAAASLIAFAILLAAHARGMKFAGASLRDYSLYAKLSTLALLVIAIFAAAATIDTWTVVRYFAGRNLPVEADAWRDSVYGLPLGFYLFTLPFYGVLRSFILAAAVMTALVYWITARGWQLRDRISEFQQAGELDVKLFALKGGLESWFLRGVGALFLLAMAFRFFLGRYEMLWNEHEFMVGMDYVDQTFTLPLQWLVIAACIAGAGLIAAGLWKSAAAVVIVPIILKAAIPAVVGAVYVRPNEISIERPYIDQHIRATRSAFGVAEHVKETEFPAKLDGRFDPAEHQAVLQNVRLWDWRAFHDTVAQIQALRPYYTFTDTDVDRYTIDGKLRQVLLTPRELDYRLLPGDAKSRWINPHFIYTHGYGLAMAEANRITPDGLPVLFIQDAPPVVKTPSLKLTRPELYYSEITNEPVFVRTAQPEFNYPAGADNVFTRYAGKGGFPVSSFSMRVAAALARADPNILLTGYLKPESRMMIRRNVRERLTALAGFIRWDTDPYLVVSDTGRLVWTCDGYTTSNAHPYARSVNVQGIGPVNYIRNAVKATVDAYDGDVHIYIFDPGDPIIRAYQRLFPRLMLPASEMPADLRAHARYPEILFRVQAEIYRTFHMRDPQAFYNKEDLWDIARIYQGQSGRPEPVAPTYVVASLPGENQAEFLLIIPFTPRNKDNMIGLMVARCDGERLGELVVLQLSKQELIFGPMQVEARINQDQTIAKDLSLWNQQGSQVLRGQMLVLPVANTFLYIEPLYIQASEARMPQLNKVVMAFGNLLIYTDTYDQALAQLSALMQGLGPAPEQKATVVAATGPVTVPGAPAATPPAGGAEAERKLDSIRNHLRRYRDLTSQGKWAEAGKELEAIESEARK